MIHLYTHLEVPALRLQPVIDEALRIAGEAEHELSLGLQVVDGLDGFVDLNRFGLPCDSLDT